MTTRTNGLDYLSEFTLLNRRAQERMRAQIAESGGSIDKVRQVTQAKLDALDDRAATTAPAELLSLQADRAFLVAQLSFLDHLEQVAGHKQVPQQRSLGTRVRSLWQRRPSLTGR